MISLELWYYTRVRNYCSFSKKNSTRTDLELFLILNQKQRAISYHANVILVGSRKIKETRY